MQVLIKPGHAKHDLLSDGPSELVYLRGVLDCTAIDAAALYLRMQKILERAKWLEEYDAEVGDFPELTFGLIAEFATACCSILADIQFCAGLAETIRQEALSGDDDESEEEQARDSGTRQAA